MSEVKCEDCKNFTRNKIGCSLNGLGKCNEFEKQQCEIKEKNDGYIDPLVYNRLYKRFGGKLFWPRIERVCEFFGEKNNG